MAEDKSELVGLTAMIVANTVAGNTVAAAEIPGLITSAHAALAGLGAPEAEPEIEKPKRAVSVRASITPDHIISMIDGKPYRVLRRHIANHGYTDEAYREAYGLPRDYPMVAPSYSAIRRGMAQRIGLGHKAAAEAAEAPVEARQAKGGRKAKAAPAEAPVAPQAKRGRPRKATS